MELVSSVEDIVGNLVVFDQELSKERDTAGWYHERIRLGRVFISYKVGTEWRFAPSRYIGYKGNSMERHKHDPGDGGKTNERITKILGRAPESDHGKYDQLREFCNRYGIFLAKNPHRFWELSLRKVETYRSLGTETPHPEELPESASLWEGATTTIHVNRFERNSKLREKCVQEWGYECRVCGFDFYATYGEIGQGFIHVHHVVSLAKCRDAHEVDPVKDLIPVCPNCHAMLHRGRDAAKPRTVKKLKKLMVSAMNRR